MKYFIKGVALGLSLNLANRFCEHAFAFNEPTLMFFSAIVFCLITLSFLVSDKVPNLLLCGFTGFFVMLFSEILLFSRFSFGDFMVYYAGMYGAFAAIPIALLITTKKIKVSNYIKKDIHMTNQLKFNYMLYAIISAMSFSYLVLPERAGISIPFFTAIQFVCLWFMAPNRKKLLLFIPIFIISLNSFISANTIWNASNFFISIILYSCLFVDFKLGEDSFSFMTGIITSITSAIAKFPLPFRWVLELNNKNAPVIKRLALAFAIAVPCAVLLIIVLANADMVFSLKAECFISHASGFINPNTLLKIVFGIIAGLFLFGTLCSSNSSSPYKDPAAPRFKGDLIIINTLLVTILVVYTTFVIIQFKYLFAGSTLPTGLTYTEYARKGFFELLTLTGVNIASILAVIKLTKLCSGKWLSITKLLCHYLCAVTIVLLISSFYRMLLYTGDDGLTRLRFFVMGFLFFEAIGLVITFIYIAKPKFNIALVYTVIALTYYVLLNVVPADNIIAKNQIDKYLKGERNDIEYVFTLSADAAPAIKYLIDNTDDEVIKSRAEFFINWQTTSRVPERWQRYNLSTERAKNLLKISTRH